MRLDQLNNMPHLEFITTLKDIFEHSPWVATSVVTQRPFQTLEALFDAMVRKVQEAPLERQLELIRAHPDLGAKLKMSDSSVSEQSGAGLDRLPPELFERFSSLNATYRKRFNFPFIIAVRDHTIDGILEHFGRRINLEPDQEREEALTQIARIAWFRLNDLIRNEE
jgi:2-oxo-4-hydroxy-4-carboxy-5-ureidoimidazoline decarboxylase